MSAAIPQVPMPSNEPVRSYAPGSAERARLEAAVADTAAQVEEIPCVIAGERVFTGNTIDITMPADHGHVLARMHIAGPAEVARAAEAAEAARPEVGGPAVGGACGGVAPGRRAPRGPPPGPGQRRVHPRAGQDLPPGGDRRCL